jgi:hypothetical protein
MQLKNILGSLGLAASLATVGGCVVRAQGHISEPVAVVEVDEEPPPPRAVVVETRPGMIFIEGRWVRDGNRWAWRDGYWERERAGYAWEQGRWDRRGNRHVWVEGRWRAGASAGPAVRDHREERHEEKHEGPVVRDHR